LSHYLEMRPKLVSAGLALVVLASAQEVATNSGKSEINDIPILGLGTFGMGGISTGITKNPTILNGTRDAIKRGLLKGYKHIDAAMIYGNEEGVGMGIAEAIKTGVSREKFWLTTKLWGDKYVYIDRYQMMRLTSFSSHHDPEAGLNGSLSRLGVAYIDLFLMHFPFGIDKNGRSFDHVEVRAVEGFTI
jgi:diketogulonate reductase-like aldo/keto reductase